MPKKHICGASTKSGSKCRRWVTASGTHCNQHSHIKSEWFYGFYVYPAVWVDRDANKLAVRTQSDKKRERHAAILEIRATVKEYVGDDYRIRVCRDGLILLSRDETNLKIAEFRESSADMAGDWSQLPISWREYLLHLNLLNFLLIPASNVKNGGPYKIFEVSELQKHNVTRVAYENDVAKRQLWYGLEPKPSLFRSSLIAEWAKHSEINRATVPIELYDALFTLYDQFAAKPTLIEALSPIIKSMFEYLSGNNKTAFFLAWNFVEIYLFRRYSAHLASLNTSLPDGRNRINSGRRKILAGNSVPVSRIIENLELAGCITFERYEELHRFRGVRNKIIHTDASCSPSEAKAVLHLAAELFESEHGIPIPLINAEHSMTGL